MELQERLEISATAVNFGLRVSGAQKRISQVADDHGIVLVQSWT